MKLNRYFLAMIGTFLGAFLASGQELSPEQQAVEKGVKYLRSLQQADGSWPHPEKVGMTALAGLTLLECSVAKNDPALVKAAEFVRQGAVQLTQTYSLALSMIFLDKLAGPADLVLIQSMGARLLTGQNQFGGWSYHCPAPSPQEILRLKKALEKAAEALDNDQGKKVDEKRVLPPEIQQEFLYLQKLGLAFGNQSGLGDTSNTTFATMGLEIARQYGFSVEKSLQLVEMRFLQTQGFDSGWNYYPAGQLYPEVMTQGFPIMQGQLTLEKRKTIQILPRNDQEIMQLIYQLGLGPFLSPQDLMEQKKLGGLTLNFVAILHGWGRTNTQTDVVSQWRIHVYPPNINLLTNRYFKDKLKYEVGVGPVIPSEIHKKFPPPPVIDLGRVRPSPHLSPKQVKEMYLTWYPVHFVVQAQGFSKEIPWTKINLKPLTQTNHFNPISWNPQNGQTVPVVSQMETGNLASTKRPIDSTPPMTTDALLTLAIARSSLLNPLPNGFPTEYMDLIRKNSMERSLSSLGNLIGQPKNLEGKNYITKVSERDNTFYSLWSLNQMAEAFSLTSIGQKNWHSWGSEMLLTNQKPDGSWQGLCRAGGADTCFALLFMRRSNWIPAVNQNLQGFIKDPGLLDPELTKKTSNGSTSDPEKSADKEAASLCEILGRASVRQQETILKQARDGQAPINTFTLALAIPQLNDKLQTSARLALAERLARGKTSELGGFLEDSEPEIRRAACNAVLFGKAKSLIPSVISLLNDEDEGVATAALRALKKLTGEDFGPRPEANPQEKMEAITAWQEWWDKKGQIWKQK